MSLLTAYATASFKPGDVAVCPPAVEYEVGFQARAAEEVVQLREGSVLVEMLADYAAMREQARGCLIP